MKLERKARERNLSGLVHGRFIFGENPTFLHALGHTVERNVDDQLRNPERDSDVSQKSKAHVRRANERDSEGSVPETS